MNGPLADGFSLAALEQSHEAIVLTTAELDAPGPYYLFANAAFERLTGYSAAEVVGKTPRVLQGPLTDRAVLARLVSNLREGRSFQGETVNYRKDGTPFHLQWSVAPIRDEGGVTRYFMAVQRDVTEQKRIEMLAASASLVDNLGYLVAGVRHELSGPIDTLRTNLSVLRAGWEAASPEEMTSALDGMLDEVRRVEEFLKALRSLDVFDQVNLAGLPLARFLDGFAQQTQEEMARRGVQFSWRSPGSPIVLADPQALHQVLLNLCANRIAALDGVPQASLDIEVSERGDLVVLRIKDNAPGMSDRQLAALFQPFQEHRQGDVRLGLVVVRKLISKMRGTLRVESATDAGTTVTISLERVSS